MDLPFWHQRWEANQIGFHGETFHVYLPSCWPRLNLAGGESVFVPLCGKSLDMLWLLQQGHRVLGVEISPVAVRAFFAENELTLTEQRAQDGFSISVCDEVGLWQGDFFALRPEHLETIGAVYDRASLVALPPEMRQRYARHLETLLPSGIPVLLVTLDYPSDEMKGPPFSVTESEVRGLFAHFDLEILETREILAEEPHFQARGLSRLTETAYRLVRRDARPA